MDTPVENVDVHSHLIVTVIRAMGLRAKTFQHGINPFALLQLGPHQASTQVLHDTQTPQWNAELSIPLPTSVDKTAVLTLTIMHRRSLFSLSDKFLGMVSFQLVDIITKERDGRREWFMLHSKPSKKLKNRGHVEVCFGLSRETDHQSQSQTSPVQTLTQPSQPLAVSQTKPLSLAGVHPLFPNLSWSHTHNRSLSNTQPPSIWESSHISWEGEDPSSPSSVQPVEGEWMPNKTSCVEGSELDMGPPSVRGQAPAGPQESATSPDRVSISNDLAACRPASLKSAEVNQTCVDLDDEEYLLKSDHSSSSSRAAVLDLACERYTIGTQTSCTFLSQPFSGRAPSFSARLRQLCFKESSQAENEERWSSRFAHGSAMFLGHSPSSYDQIPILNSGRKQPGFLSRLFFCFRGE